MSAPKQLWLDVAAAAELGAGQVMEVVADGQIIAVTNVDGRFYAVDGVCSHQGGPLGKGELKGCTLTCPWHGWQYDVSTGEQKLSQTIRQASYAVRVAGDRIEVRLGPYES